MSARVVIAEDGLLFREGIARLLAEAGFEVVGQAGDAEEFLRNARSRGGPLEDLTPHSGS